MRTLNQLMASFVIWTVVVWLALVLGLILVARAVNG